MVLYAVLLAFLIGAAAFFASWIPVRNRLQAGQLHHSLPKYYGMYSASWAVFPPVLVVLALIAAQSTVLDWLVVNSLPADIVANLSDDGVALLLSEIRQVAKGLIFSKPEPYVVEAAERFNSYKELWQLLIAGSALTTALLGFVFTRLRVAPEFRARDGVERLLTAFMWSCSVLAILTTAAIVLSLFYESLRFFDRVPVQEFLFGLNWEPQIPIRADQVAGLGAFGAVPVFSGTLLIAGIALAFAAPVGLLVAVFMAEYAPSAVRGTIKPIIELLAGVPTIVYGFFAVQMVSPFARDALAAISIDLSPTAALVAGGVMGVMLIPFISSLSDDALNAVPQSMRDGSYALGATQSETITRVLFPAALPGIMGGILLATSRAIGETMIVVMAAGIIANLTANPLDSASTVTVQIVTLLIGDTEFDNPKTLSAFALGFVLFLVTLMLNIIALRIVQKYREQYE